MMKSKYVTRIAIGIVTCCFVAWAALFIYRSSYVAIDGQRYFSLFDDGMISMRYGWNFSHGAGLVWNSGERIEGYTNPLMTLYMALVSLVMNDKRLAVLVIQISGIGFLLGTAWIITRIVARLAGSVQDESYRRAKILSYVMVLAYYPLVYWSLMGMESGMLALFLALSVLSTLRWTQSQKRSEQVLLPLWLGLAFLTRPDALVPAVVIWAYLFCKIRRLRSVGMSLSLYLLIVLGQEVFRWMYYGTWVPNTYVLKIEGMPVLDRLRNGLGFIRPFLATSSFVLLVVGIGVTRRRRAEELLLLAIPVAYIGYQVWIGGDAWDYWRMLAPSIPLLLALFAHEMFQLLGMISENFRLRRTWSPRGANWKIFTAAISMAVLALFMLNVAYVSEILLIDPPFLARSNWANINTALALEELTTQDATIGMFYAGTTPYYAARKAIDFLGKSDPHIAQLPPDLSGAVGWNRMYSVPGHNKYDLIYSIQNLQPTYVQVFHWGTQDLSNWAEQQYVSVIYKGVTLFLRKNSAAVNWDKLSDIKPCCPW